MLYLPLECLILFHWLRKMWVEIRCDDCSAKFASSYVHHISQWPNSRLFRKKWVSVVKILWLKCGSSDPPKLNILKIETNPLRFQKTNQCLTPTGWFQGLSVSLPNWIQLLWMQNKWVPMKILKTSPRFAAWMTT